MIGRVGSSSCRARIHRNNTLSPPPPHSAYGWKNANACFLRKKRMFKSKAVKPRMTLSAIAAKIAIADVILLQNSVGCPSRDICPGAGGDVQSALT
mmetsp:Transcript_30990/g.54378  ORF Transcript_30990/g.54378 Transcript_30990/m.54378 type:complete len:96 (+) Transcript_30990:1436-1723(+)